MVLTGSLQLSHGLGLCKNQGCKKKFERGVGRSKLDLWGSTLSSRVSFQRQHSWNVDVSNAVHRPLHTLPYRHNAFKCHSSLPSGLPSELPRLNLKIPAVALKRCVNILQGSPLPPKLALAAGFTVFAAWGFLPLIRLIRNLILHKNDSSWKKSNTHYILTSYLQPMLLWTGAILICRALDPIVLPTEASQIVKLRLLTFVRSLSTVLAFAYCLSSVIQQTQKFFMEVNDPSDTRNMGFQFAGKAVYSAVWIAAFSLFMELLGFSTQKWVTAGGLGTVLLTLAGREIFTNFLSSAMIHATRPFVTNEWIQTKIEGYEVSGTVEHVGWWSPTIVRGEDREAVHIPNHKFTVNVVRNLTQKTHWRIKTHLAISHLDVNKINHIVADMRKVLAKNPQVEQQRLHRRVFLENINPENQALMILISCFVKTSHFEEYLCVKEAILLDLLRVISHHRARLATPIRTVQKIYGGDADLENVPFADSVYSRNGVTNRPLLLIEPAYKINGEDKTKSRTVRPNGEKDGKTTPRPPASDTAPNGDRDGKTAPRPLASDTVPNGEIDGKTSPRPPASDTAPNGEKDGKNAARPPASDTAPDGEKDGKTAPRPPALDTALNGEKDRKTAPHPPASDTTRNGEKGRKTAPRSPRSPAPNGEKDGKTTPCPPASDIANEDAKENPKIGEKAAGKPVSTMDPSKVPEAVSITDSKVPEAADSEPDNAAAGLSSDTSAQKTPNGKQPKSTSLGNHNNSTSSSSEITASERTPVPKPPPIPKPVLEENIVLGVALEGSKRTLPIEDDMAPPHGEVTEMAGRLNSADKDKKEGQIPSPPTSTSIDP